MTLFFPFTGCGTNVMHDTEDYVYTNEIVFKTRDNVLVTLLQFRCVYEDKYIVSYEHGLQPIERYNGISISIDLFDGVNPFLEQFNFTRPWENLTLIWRCMKDQIIRHMKNCKNEEASISTIEFISNLKCSIHCNEMKSFLVSRKAFTIAT